MKDPQDRDLATVEFLQRRTYGPAMIRGFGDVGNLLPCLVGVFAPAGSKAFFSSASFLEGLLIQPAK